MTEQIVTLRCIAEGGAVAFGLRREPGHLYTFTQAQARYLEQRMPGMFEQVYPAPPEAMRQMVTELTQRLRAELESSEPQAGPDEETAKLTAGLVDRLRAEVAGSEEATIVTLLTVEPEPAPAEEPPAPEPGLLAAKPTTSRPGSRRRKPATPVDK
jgi:hypothetical protein